jgi:hypothetical protein
MYLEGLYCNRQVFKCFCIENTQMSYTYIQNVDECYIEGNGWYSCRYADLDKYEVLYTNIYLGEYRMYTRMDKKHHIDM